jgi:hypothetical protein
MLCLSNKIIFVKVILVISKNFTQSHYCNYELNLARLHSVEQGRNLLVPVVLDPVDMESMSECLRWIVRKLTYIQWPRHPTEDRVEFWYKLRQAIADPGFAFWVYKPEGHEMVAR